MTIALCIKRVKDPEAVNVSVTKLQRPSEVPVCMRVCVRACVAVWEENNALKSTSLQIDLHGHPMRTVHATRYHEHREVAEPLPPVLARRSAKCSRR